MEEVENLAEVLKALSDPTRLRLIVLLATPMDKVSDDHCCEGRNFYCVNALAHRLGVSQSAVSQHLRILRQAHLVRGIRRGKFMHYIIDTEGLKQFTQTFKEVMEINLPTT